MATPAKICIRCKRDCSAKPRMKDPQGRYVCRDCLDSALSAGAPAEGPIPFADDPLPAGLLDGPEPTVPVGLRTCPSCRSSIPHGAALCVQCGFDVRAGKKLAIDRAPLKEESAIPPREGKCGKCGYSLKGLKLPRCPECGTVVGRLSDRDRRNQDNADTVKWAYLKPLIQLGVGLGGAAIYYAAMREPEAILFHALKYVIQVPVGLVVFLSCCALWIGFDAPIHMLMLRLAAIYALVDLTAIITGFIPIWFIQLVIVLFVYVGLLADSLDLDLQDAVIVGILTYGVKIIMAMMVFAWLFAHT